MTLRRISPPASREGNKIPKKIEKSTVSTVSFSGTLKVRQFRHILYYRISLMVLGFQIILKVDETYSRLAILPIRPNRIIVEVESSGFYMFSHTSK